MRFTDLCIHYVFFQIASKSPEKLKKKCGGACTLAGKHALQRALSGKIPDQAKPHLRIEVFVPFEVHDELRKHIDALAAVRPTYICVGVVAAENFIEKAFLTEASAVASAAQGRLCSLRESLTLKFKKV